MFDSKKSAFTLSEVLIALTIIGVVAAITVPRVMTGANTKANVVKLKRAYTGIQEALRMATAKENYNMGDISSLKHDEDHPYNAQDLLSRTLDAKVKTISGGYTGSGVPISRDPNSLYWPTLSGNYSTNLPILTGDDLLFVTRSGVFYIIKAITIDETLDNNCNGGKPCIMYIDINGTKGPNEVVTCTANGPDALMDIPDPQGSDTVYEEPEACTVDDKAVTDIYPFVIYNNDVKPATKATVAVLEK